MKITLTKLASIVIVTGLFTACSKDDATPVILTATTATNVVAEPTLTGNHYAFYSLENNQAVAVTDSASAKWDIAFRSTTIIINGGTSGPAAGGAFVQKAASFDTYKTIPTDSAFKVDGASSFAVTTGSGNGWYNYDFNTNIISPIPGNILVIRTASGKFAKVEILSYYKDAPASPLATSTARYFTFRFVYQPGGGKTF